MDGINLQIPHPATISVVGSTGGGKTHLVLDLIRNRDKVFSEPLQKVCYIYSDFQPSFHHIQATDPDVNFTQDLSCIESLTGPCLLVIDDHQEAIAKGKNNELVTRLYTTHAHHRNISTILILQNPFSNGLRTINLNTQVLILCDNPRDRSVARFIARQICPGRTELLTSAYNRAVAQREFGYLVIDLHPKNKRYKYWLRSHVMPSDDLEVYTE